MEFLIENFLYRAESVLLANRKRKNSCSEEEIDTEKVDLTEGKSSKYYFATNPFCSNSKDRIIELSFLSLKSEVVKTLLNIRVHCMLPIVKDDH